MADSKRFSGLAALVSALLVAFATLFCLTFFSSNNAPLAWADESDDSSGSAKVLENTKAYALFYENGDFVLQRGDAEDPQRGRLLQKWSDIENFDAPETSNGTGYCLWTKDNPIDGSQVKNVYIKDTIHPRSTAEWFFGFTKITTIHGLENLDTSQTKSMLSMFSLCLNLQSLDLSSFRTDNATSFEHMFNRCESLRSLNLSTFRTSNVKYFDCMFADCTKLTGVDLTRFDTSQGIWFDLMFSNNQALTTLDLSSFNLRNATSADGMFLNCSVLSRVTLGSQFRFVVWSPTSEYQPYLPANHRWQNESTGRVYEASQIPSYVAATYVWEGTGGGGTTGPSTGDVTVYRLYNPYAYIHLYTASEDEVKDLVEAGWSDEGVYWYAPTPGPGTSMTVRLYNPYNGDHYYVAESDQSQISALMTAGWLLDSEEAWLTSAPASTGKPIYVLFNPYAQVDTHLYTSSAQEADDLVGAGYERNTTTMWATRLPEPRS